VLAALAVLGSVAFFAATPPPRPTLSAGERAA
jgi:hypothetical protein